MADCGADEFTEFEIEVLQELMNIAFGQAAADLAEVVEIYVHLAPPRVRLLGVSELPAFVDAAVNDFKHCNIVEQHYHGDSEGVAFLIFPHGAEREFISFFNASDTPPPESDLLAQLEREVLTEVGNILIGACVGKIADLLEGGLYYLPPRTSVGESFNRRYLDGTFAPGDMCMAMRTRFSFDEKALEGHLFLLYRQQSISGLKKALARFLKRYEG